MNSQALTQCSLQEVAERIMNSRRITREDQHLLLGLYDLTAQEHHLINQVFDRLRMGLLKVVD